MLLNNFNAVEHKDRIVQWIRDWFEENGKDCKAVIGISGGKDSSVAAALCVEALGRERVFGVLMSCGYQSDIDASYKLCNYLNIRHREIDIFPMAEDFGNSLVRNGIYPTEQAEINLLPRIRMTTLYFVSQSIGGRVVCTDNLSESYIGYSTRWGDNIGDFAPLANYTASEVVAIGEALGLPYDLTHKTPSDGLCGQTDEDRFGFTYEQLDTYIRTGKCDSEKVIELIKAKHKANRFKQMTLPQPYSFQRIYGWE
jgi:NAD+ synthase